MSTLWTRTRSKGISTSTIRSPRITGRTFPYSIRRSDCYLTRTNNSRPVCFPWHRWDRVRLMAKNYTFSWGLISNSIRMSRWRRRRNRLTAILSKISRSFLCNSSNLMKKLWIWIPNGFPNESSKEDIKFKWLKHLSLLNKIKLASNIQRTDSQSNR